MIENGVGNHFLNAVHVHDMMHTNLFKLLHVYRLQSCLLLCCIVDLFLGTPVKR